MPSTERTHLSTVPGAAPPAPTPTRLRASDAEREDAVARLHHALGEGRLDLADVEPRVAAAYAAQYRDELPPLLADLPAGPTVPGTSPGSAPSWAEVWLHVVWRLRASLLGAADRPTPAQCRTAARLTLLAVAWLLLWAFVGAAVIA